MGQFWNSNAGAATIGAIGAAGSGLFGSLFSVGSQRRQYKYNLRLQRQQQEWQKYMWDLQNQYNLPVNEIKRLVSAGVNPALAFSNGGASAGPVPVSGSAGGVSAPTASMPNIGESALLAAQNAQRVENESKVADSVSEKNTAEAEAVRKQAGLTESQTKFQNLQNDILERTSPIIIRNRLLDSLIKENEKTISSAEAKIAGIRAGSYREENALRLNYMRYRNDRVKRSTDQIDAQISLLRSQGRLTDQEAYLVSLRAKHALANLYIAEWNRDMAYEFNRTVFGSGDKVNAGSEAFQNIISAAKKEYANRLSQGLLTEKELELDYDFQVGFGAEQRFYEYENLRRGANEKRANIWYGGLNAIVGSASAAITAGSSALVRSAAYRAFKRTNRSFGYDPRGAIVPNSKFYPDGSFGDYSGF